MVIRGGEERKITKTSQNKENHKKNKTTEIPELNKHPLNHTVLIKSLWAPHSSRTLPNRTLLVLQDSQDHFHALQKDCEMFIDIHKHLQAAENWGNSKDCSKGLLPPVPFSLPKDISPLAWGLLIAVLWSHSKVFMPWCKTTLSLAGAPVVIRAPLHCQIKMCSWLHLHGTDQLCPRDACISPGQNEGNK